ncbi:PREDICTED: lysophosphatidic acid phosphatase type 6-like [Priapulus caudatus]|uniref:Lysophosphatidic acid phosphatase type 6-like n=1 Tax=Priapulus caudatus TaxID=37621 RepID=A0ABM1DSH4_PRICU|nr:PREDICTED: lysophosphatidic acid phosphatase type 6-like [Priapulus caudatus]
MWRSAGAGVAGVSIISAGLCAFNSLRHSNSDTSVTSASSSWSLRGDCGNRFGSWATVKAAPSASTQAATSTEGLRLHNVQLFARHGARTPLAISPPFTEYVWNKEELDDLPKTMIPVLLVSTEGGPRPKSRHEEFFKTEQFKGGAYIGQLTKLGQSQGYTLGQKLRKRYVEEVPFLSPTYEPGEIYARSSNLNRTAYSLRCVLAGLLDYPRREITDMVEIEISPSKEENLYPNTNFCPALNAMQTVGTAPMLADMCIPGHRKDRETVAKLIGIPADLLSFIKYRDLISCAESHGMEIPPDLKCWSEKITRYASQMLTFVCGGMPDQGDLVLQMGVGPLLTMVAKNVFKSLSHQRTYKMQLYSCHDTTIHGLLIALGIPEDGWPPYCADLAIETYARQDKAAFVQVKYLGEVQKLPTCKDSLCTISEFKETVSRYYVTAEKWDKLCGSNPESRSQAAQQPYVRPTGV